VLSVSACLKHGLWDIYQQLPGVKGKIMKRSATLSETLSETPPETLSETSHTHTARDVVRDVV